jgi:hypothetical protein
VLSFRVRERDAPVQFAPDIVAIVGYAGRDRASVRQHVSELVAQNVPAPDKVPVLYGVTPDRLCQTRSITVGAATTSGEAEVVLLLVDGETYVSVGSDHTDRALEAKDIPGSKQACPKVVGREAWRLRDVETHWDELELHSWVGEAHELYQRGRVEALLPPADILEFVRSNSVRALDRAVIFCGTLPLVSGQFVPAPRFRARLVDPVRRRRLGVDYECRQLDWILTQ